MSLTLTKHPVEGTSDIFAGFEKIEFEFKREDIAVIDIESGTGGVKIEIGTDLTTYLNEGDTVYIYSEGTNYTYNTTGTVLSVTSTEVTTDIPFIEGATGGYMNYFKNYYVEMQCVNKNNPAINILPLVLESDGDAAGNIIIDVSIANDLNRQRGDIAKQHIGESLTEFKVKYRQVYQGSSESYTEDSKLLIVLYATEKPEKEVILNQLDLPKIYLGYPAALTVAHKDGQSGEQIEIIYRELDNNNVSVGAGTLGLLNSDDNGYLMWEWESANTIENNTKYIEFTFEFEALFDFRSPDFAYPDFLTQ